MNNPPAFPTSHQEPCDYNGHNNSQKIVIDQGMTLRDYFAAKAMQGFCSDHKWRDKNTPDYPFLDTGTLEGNTAIAAYKQADAMLKARES